MTSASPYSRRYRDDDLSHLQDTMSEWIAGAGRIAYDHVGELPHRIYENLRGRRPVGDLVRVWEEGEEIVGIGIGLRFGQAFDLFTAPWLHGSADERRMLAATARDTASYMDPTEPYVLTDCFSTDSVRIDQLTRLGFEHFRIWDAVQERDLRVPIDAPRVPRGFVIRTARMDDAEQLATARNNSFEEEWTGETYRTEVMAKPGYAAEREVVVQAPDERIVAFAVYWIDKRNATGHFEPIGTHRDFQRRGLGRAAMTYAMRRMIEQGMVTVTVNHNAENLAARKLYQSMGFLQTEQTLGFRRAVSALSA